MDGRFDTDIHSTVSNFDPLQKWKRHSIVLKEKYVKKTIYREISQNVDTNEFIMQALPVVITKCEFRMQVKPHLALT